ncbi:glucose 1-dehydrogenase [Candidatus Poribacteria bacterium]|nr:glucose 1-dehydrogenase [Candidatus Poribacteria bacterium]
MVDLHGKVALITGSSRGIGRGCAVEMATCGADIVINYRTHPDEAAEVAEIVRGLGRNALTVGADIADRDAVETMVQQGIDQFGKIDILVNNAAMSIRKPFLEIPVADVERTIDVCMWGVFHCSQVAARHMVERGEGGKILIISSVHAFIPFGNSVAYNTAKAGINHMGYTMATELTEHRINVNVIEPGWTDTPGERNFATEEELREGGKKLPWGRLGTIEDIGKTAAFLCSDAADYITGACLRVDGGFWLPR